MNKKLTIQTMGAFDRIHDSLKHDSIKDDLDEMILNLDSLLNKAKEIKTVKLQSITGEY
jgi:hypothetical protein